MATATELLLQEEIDHLQEIAKGMGWTIRIVSGVQLIISLPARDSSIFWLRVDCEHYKAQPPAFNWYNPDTEALNQPADTPRGSGYFHSSGCICAPWNRLAYKECNPTGPHGGWQLANWLSHERTGETTTLPAMILRISIELKSPNFQGRMA